MAPTIIEILKESETRLADVDSPRLSAEVLAAEVLGCSRLNMIVDRKRELGDEEIARIRALVNRRATGEPLAYVIGRQEFYGLDFSVTSDVLIPRPETEHIIEEVEASFGPDEIFSFADLGTGSGILAVTIAHLFPKATGVAVDLSAGALSVARTNAAAHGVNDRVEFVHGDFTRPLLDDASCDLIVSNPPYVTRQEFDDASHEVTAHEPVTSLVSGEDGLDHIRAMAPLVVKALRPGGRFFMEMGFRQGDGVKKIFTNELPEFSEVSIKKDLAGHDRVAILQK